MLSEPPSDPVYLPPPDLPRVILSYPMHHHSRAYSFDNQNGDEQYPRGAASHHYARGFPHIQGSGQYYLQSGDNLGDVYPRNMTHVSPSSQQYPTTGGQARYYQTPGGGGRPSSSSSHVQQSLYPAQAPYYQQTNHVAGGQFIPTPSDLYNNYPPRQIPLSPQSPTLDPYAGQYPPPPHSIVPSSRSPEPRSSRPSTSRQGISPISPGSPMPSPSGERFRCELCPKTFSRSHDRKRHHETQHSALPQVHRCRYCEKEFSRADSLKRHLDNGCDEMPS